MKSQRQNLSLTVSKYFITIWTHQANTRFHLESETLNSSTFQFFITNGQLKFGNPNFNENLLQTNNASIYKIGEGFFNTIGLSGNTNLDNKKCDNCGQPGKYIVNYGSGAITDNINTCSTCNRNFCSTCWPKNIIGFATTGITFKAEKCPTCTNNIKQT